jgi:hypothetical protein
MFVSLYNRSTVAIDLNKAIKDAYDVEIIEVYTENLFELKEYREWEDIGFDVSAFEKDYPDEEDQVSIQVLYVLTDQGEKLVYSYPVGYKQRSQPLFIDLVETNIGMSQDEMMDLIKDMDDLSSLRNSIITNQYFMLPAFRTGLNAFEGLGDILGEKMQDVIFFQTYDDTYIFFVYKNVFYITHIMSQDDLVCVYPNQLNLIDFINVLDAQ